MRTSPCEAEWALTEARRKYVRVLSRWAHDALMLRRHGLDRPVYGGRVAQELREFGVSAQPPIDQIPGHVAGHVAG